MGNTWAVSLKAGPPLKNWNRKPPISTIGGFRFGVNGNVFVVLTVIIAKKYTYCKKIIFCDALYLQMAWQILRQQAVSLEYKPLLKIGIENPRWSKSGVFVLQRIHIVQFCLLQVKYIILSNKMQVFHAKHKLTEKSSPYELLSMFQYLWCYPLRVVTC